MDEDSSSAVRRVVPAWRRTLFHPLTIVAAGALALAMAVYLYSRGATTILGYYFGPLLVGLVIYVVLMARNPGGRQEGMVGQEALRRLRAVDDVLRTERALPAAERPSGASDLSLDDAREQVDLAMQRFAWGDFSGTLPMLEELASVGRTWDDDSPLGSAQGALDEATTALRASTRS